MQKGEHTDQDLNRIITSEAHNLLLAQNSELRAENLYLRQELAQLKRMIFGSKSERHIGNDNSQLILGLDVKTEETKENETEQITYSRSKPENKKGSAIRLALPAHLHQIGRASCREKI